MSIIRGLLCALFFVSLTTVRAQSSTEARDFLPMVGASPGDATVTARCKPGDVLSGFQARAGLWLNAIQPICSTPETSESSMNRGYAGSNALGGVGGAPVSASCLGRGDGRVATVKIDLTRDGKRIKNLIVYCSTSAGGARYALVAGLTGDSKSHDDCAAVHSDCSAPAQERYMAQQTCPQGSAESLVGMSVRFGTDVNSIGFLCDRADADSAAHQGSAILNNTTFATPASIPAASGEPAVEAVPSAVATGYRTRHRAYMVGIDLPGDDYRNGPIAGAAKDCRALCLRDGTCKAWTWVKAGVQNPSPMCWLKNDVPASRVENPNAVSGIRAPDRNAL